MGTRSAKGCAAVSQLWKSSWFLINHRETEENQTFPLHPSLPLESQTSPDVSKEKLCKPRYAKIFIVAGTRRLQTMTILTFMNAKPLLRRVCVTVHYTVVCVRALLWLASTCASKSSHANIVQLKFNQHCWNSSANKLATVASTANLIHQFTSGWFSRFCWSPWEKTTVLNNNAAKKTETTWKTAHSSLIWEGRSWFAAS